MTQVDEGKFGILTAMCGRIEYVVTSKKVLEGRYGARLVEGVTFQGLVNARYNIAPSSHTPIITSENSEEFQLGHWGYLPTWANKQSKATAVINARSETVFEKPYFKSSIITRRCIIPVTGFFEWHRSGSKKTPFRFHMDGELFSLAGIYTTSKDENGDEMPHYAILTTHANALMQRVHERIPVILEQEAEDDWVSDEIDEHAMVGLFKPYKVKGLKKDEISSLVNNPRNDRPEILTPVH